MKKQWLLSLIFTFICGIIYGQNLIRVNNNPGADPDYLTLQEANDNANNGDTIYVEGSATSYTGVDISKSLTIIGPGFFLSENDSTQANGLEATTGNIYFNAGSSGSVISGIKANNTIYIYVDNIVVTRCYTQYIKFADNSDNALILQNYVYGSIQRSSTSAILTNVIIANNIVGESISFGSNNGPLQVFNNVLFGTGVYHGIYVYNSSIANNIITGVSAKIVENTGNTIVNNLLARDGTNANGNQYNVVMADVFVGFPTQGSYSTDGKWQLKAGSPAIGAGVSGVDCGVFGGTTPYVLSGLPAVPRIYEAVIASTAYSDQGLQCTIKIKSGE